MLAGLLGQGAERDELLLFPPSGVAVHGALKQRC